MTRYVVQASWDDAPHLSEQAKTDLARAYLPIERDARIRGIPRLGAGAIYPIPETEIVVEPFGVPKYWKHVYGLDVGWNRTAAIWAAHDTQADVAYLYSEHYRSQAEPAVHAQAILARGRWIPGVVDPAARGRSQADGRALYDQYRALGLMLTPADNAVDAGLAEVWTRLSTGRLKIFSTLVNWLAEYRLYHRDEKGRIPANLADHLMDATRYLVMSGLAVAIFRVDISTKPQHQVDYDPHSRWRNDPDGRSYDPARNWR